MKISEFGWYPMASAVPEGGLGQALRRGGRKGEIFSVVAPMPGGAWTAVVNLHLDESQHRHLECESELEALLASEVWLEELIEGETTS